MKTAEDILEHHRKKHNANGGPIDGWVHNVNFNRADFRVIMLSMDEHASQYKEQLEKYREALRLIQKHFPKDVLMDQMNEDYDTFESALLDTEQVKEK